MRDCADTARAELIYVFSDVLPKIQAIYSKTRAGHKQLVLAELSKQLENVKKQAVK